MHLANKCLGNRSPYSALPFIVQVEVVFPLADHGAGRLSPATADIRALRSCYAYRKGKRPASSFNRISGDGLIALLQEFDPKPVKFKKIVMLGYSQSDFGDLAFRRLASMCEENRVVSENSPEVARQLAEADCLLVETGIAVDKAMINAAPNLKYIGVFGTGCGRIDVKYSARRGITVCNTPGYSTEGVAELAFGLILEHIREIDRAKSRGRSGNYSGFGYRGYEIRNKKFGVIGLGRIGGRIAEIASNGFGAHVSYWSRNRKTEVEKTGIRYEDISAVLADSDFISINLAHVADTEKFIDAARIKLIKPGAVVVHLAPIEVIDLDEMEERLKLDDITLILDHSDELNPEQAARLARYANCVMYPSIACITQEAKQKKLGLLIENIENYLDEKPSNTVA